MTITITDAEGSIEEILARVVAHFIKEKGDSLQLITAAQAYGILNVTINALNALNLDKVDVHGNGGTIRYRLADVEALVKERTTRGTRKKGGRS